MVTGYYKGGKTMRKIILKVEGMHCAGCENRVKNVVSLIDGVEEVSANHEEGIVVAKINDEVSIEEIKEAIENLEFTIKE